MKECQSCGGRYESIGADGVQYFHVCAPLNVIAVTRNGKRTTVRISDLQPDDLIRVRRGAATIDVAVKDREADDVALEQHDAPRPNARDENIAAYVNDVAIVKAEGAGAIDVIAEADPAAAFPPLEG